MLEAVPFSKSQLRIVVRSQTYLDALRKKTNASFVTAPLAGDLVSVCYRDLPLARRPAALEELARLGLEGSAAIAACLEATNSVAAPLASLWKPLPEKRLGIIQTGDDVTGYMATPENWRELANQLGGPVVAAPGTDTILYGRGDTDIDVGALETIAEQMHGESDWPVSASVYRWTEQGWKALP